VVSSQSRQGSSRRLASHKIALFVQFLPPLFFAWFHRPNWLRARGNGGRRGQAGRHDAVSWSSESFVNACQPCWTGIPSQRSIVAKRYRERSGCAVGLPDVKRRVFSRVSPHRQRMSNDPV